LRSIRPGEAGYHSRFSQGTKKKDVHKYDLLLPEVYQNNEKEIEQQPFLLQENQEVRDALLH
jgi:hypothetical protein